MQPVTNKSAKRFLDLEAVRESDSSGEDDPEDGDYDASFVDDDDQGGGASQTSMYLKSLSGMQEGKQKVRLVGKKCSYEDVSCQVSFAYSTSLHLLKPVPTLSYRINNMCVLFDGFFSAPSFLSETEV